MARKTSKRKLVGARPVLQFRVHEDIYEQLRTSAADRRLTLSEEASRRLSGSFRSEKESLLRAILAATLGGREPKWITPDHGREMRFSGSVKAAMKQRIAGFIDSLPECPESTLSDDEVEQLWEMVQRKQAELDAAKKKGKQK